MSHLGTPAPRDLRVRAVLENLTAWQAADVDRYSIHWCEWDNGAVLSRGTYELDEAVATSRAEIVRLIAAGEWDHIEAIRCGNEALNSYRNVTPEIADEVLQHCIDNEIALSAALRGWLEALNSYRNVTPEIADEVLQHCIDNEIALSAALRGWLHTHAGIRAVEDAVSEHPYLDDDYHTGWNR